MPRFRFKKIYHENNLSLNGMIEFNTRRRLNREMSLKKANNPKRASSEALECKQNYPMSCGSSPPFKKQRLCNGNPSSTTNSAMPKDRKRIEIHQLRTTLPNDHTHVVIPNVVKDTALEKYFVHLDAQKRTKIVDILHGKRYGKDHTEEVPLAIETIDTDLQIKRIFRMNWDEGKWKIVKLKLRIKSIIKRCQENKISIT
eukprot:1009405_1